MFLFLMRSRFSFFSRPTICMTLFVCLVVPLFCVSSSQYEDNLSQIKSDDKVVFVYIFVPNIFYPWCCALCITIIIAMPVIWEHGNLYFLATMSQTFESSHLSVPRAYLFSMEIKNDYCKSIFFDYCNTLEIGECGNFIYCYHLPALLVTIIFFMNFDLTEICPILDSIYSYKGVYLELSLELVSKS